MWLFKRLTHLGRITRWGWFVTYEIGWVTLFVNLDFIIGKYGSEQTRTWWEHVTHPQWGWRTWLIGALAIAIIFVIEGSYRNHSKDEKDRLQLLAEKDELKDELKNIGGPKLLIGFGQSNWGPGPLIVLNQGGGMGHSVTLRVPRDDGSLLTSKTINVLRDDDTLVGWQAGDGNRITANDLIMSGAHKSALTVTCMDAECRWFIYTFEPLEKLSGYNFKEKICVGRTKPT